MHVSSARKAAQLATTRPVTFMAFDLLRLFGSDLTSQPWSARRELLERLELRSSAWQVPPVYDDGEELFEATRDQGLEGVVSKRRSSPYAAGRRSAGLAQVPAPRDPLGRRRRVAARDGDDRADGRRARRHPGRSRAGGSMPAASVPGWPAPRVPGSASCWNRCRAAPLPFSNDVPREDAAGATWVEPRVVVEVQSLGRGSTGKLRQPAYLGVRTDLTPDDLHEVSDA